MVAHPLGQRRKRLGVNHAARRGNDAKRGDITFGKAKADRFQHALDEAHAR